MKKIAPAMTVATAMTAADAQTRPEGGIAPDAVYQVAPQLGRYTDEVLFGAVWPDADSLSARDRSLTTVSALVAGGRIAQVRGHMGRALDNGVTPEELSELVTHLAFYAGWPVAISSVYELKEVFDARGIRVEIDTRATPLTPDAPQEAARAASVDRNARPFAPGLADDTDDVLFADLWLRGGLAPRDRSLVTVAGLVAMGQAEQLGYHLGRAMDAGLTRDEASEMVRHLAYYTGWPRAFSAVGPIRAVFEARADATPAPELTELSVVRADGETFAGPEATFTGTVTVGPLFSAPGAARMGGGLVRFDAGAHTAWHTHPLGQTLYVTEGCALVQIEGQEVVSAGPGDFVMIPPAARHWHGASADGPMAHIALSEAVDGSAVTWMEKLSDAEYATAGGCSTQ